MKYNKADPNKTRSACIMQNLFSHELLSPYSFVLLSQIHIHTLCAHQQRFIIIALYS